MIPSAVESLRRGIELERERFRGKPFIVATTEREYDYDGATETFALREGFSGEEPAIEYATRCAHAALNARDDSWRLIETKGQPPFSQRTPRETVTLAFQARFKLATDSGYDSVYFEADVLHVKDPEIIGCELFTYLAAESEVAWYLVKRGEAHVTEK